MGSSVSMSPGGAETYRKPFATGWTMFAGCLMIFGGLMAVFEGISAIANHTRYVITGNYVYSFNVTGWGWFHLILGILIMLAGVALFTGAVWARVIGVVVVGFNMVVNFLWLPYYPVWAIVLIGVDVFIIWALTAGTHRVEPPREYVAPPPPPSAGAQPPPPPPH
ncbi:DUF7144 family membrane protein [Kitasatospora acidiphila]